MAGLTPQELEHLYDVPGELQHLAQSAETKELIYAHIEAHRIASSRVPALLGKILIAWGGLEYDLDRILREYKLLACPPGIKSGRWIPADRATRIIRMELADKIKAWRDFVEFALLPLPTLWAQAEDLSHMITRHYGVRNNIAHGPVLPHGDFREPPGLVCTKKKYLPNNLGRKTSHGERLLTVSDLEEHLYYVGDLNSAIGKVNAVAFDHLGYTIGRSYPQGWPTSILPHREPYRRKARLRK